MNPIVLVVGAFVLMEGVSYATHRWVMHGFAMPWHRSHHAPSDGRFEKNDLFPVCFSGIGVLLFALGALGWESVGWVGLGVTAYGAAYSFVHEVYIHHRLPMRLPRLPYIEWLRDSHRIHHLTSAEPYGMLLPLLRSEARARRSTRDPLERSRS